MATVADQSLRFTHLPHPAPTPAEARAQILANPGFGTNFSDHMVVIEWDEGRGWHDATVGPRQPIALDPAAAVLHYAQEIFEGLKAYRQQDGGLALFRPEANAARFNRSAERLAMPELPEDLFIESVKQLVKADRDWFPDVEGGSLYLRPFMIATEAFLGVRPAKSYKYLVIASPAGNYFKSGAPAVSIWVSEYTRAAPGGTGAAKCGGNYAASLVPQAEALARGHDQVVFLDAAEHRWIEELGGMNLYFVYSDGRLVTPALTGTLLPGVTRDSILTLGRDMGLDPVEGRVSTEDWEQGCADGTISEVFACGTAAVVTPVGEVKHAHGSFQVSGNEPGAVTMKVREALLGIQQGTAPDSHGWMTRVT